MIRAGIRRVFALSLRGRRRWERDVEEEIMLHLTLRAEQLVAAGRSAEDAYAEAVRRFGPLDESRARMFDAARHRERHMQRTEWLADARQDLRFALHTLAGQKLWTAVTVLTLALGIGATTAVFSVVSTMILHPIAYPHADRIVLLYQQPSSGNNTGLQVTILPSARIMRAWRADAHSFEAIEAYNAGTAGMETDGDPSTVNTARVLPSFLSFAGERPLIGRMFTDGEAASKSHVVLLGESIWRQRFGSNPNVLGKYITLDGASYAIIGVLPAALQLPSASRNSSDMWLPLDIHDDQIGMYGIGRLRPGIATETAQRELDSIQTRIGNIQGDHATLNSIVMPPSSRVSYRDSLMLLTWAVALVLLVACANVAHLVLARSSTRQRELAIRAALGAGRWRIVRQLLAESLLIAATGTALGVFAGWIGLHVMISLRPSSLDSLKAARLDGTTLGIALAVGIASTVVFALLAAFRSGGSSSDALRTGSLTASSSRAQRRVRGLLVVTEMALSALLIVGATMLVRSVINLQSAKLGFEPHGLYSIKIPFEEAHISAPAARAAFTKAYLDRVRRIPAVTSLAATTSPPGWFFFDIGRLEIEGQPAPPATSTSFITANQTQNAFFATMRIPLVRGSLFTDTSATSTQVIVNASFARKTWPSGDAVGQRIRIVQTDSEPWLTVVGVAADAQTSGPLSEATAPVLYLPPGDRTWANVIIRTSGGAASLAPAVAILRQMGIRRPPTPASAEQVVDKAIDAPRFVMLLLTTFTVLALLLAAIGMYGVMSYRVAQTTREIGIRIALGATPARIGRTVLGSGVALAVGGAIVGLTAAAWGTRLIQAQLYGVSRLDPVAFTVGAVVLVGVAVLACVIPTRRALSIDPVSAIRAE